ncbi:MAG: putative toxin-antitoxin system toxin component, PIN family [Acidobacteriota bacterium]
MVKAVFDLTIIVSAILKPAGITGELINRARAGDFVLLLSQEIIDESRATLRTHKKLRKQYRYTDEEVAYFFSRLRNIVTIVSDLPFVRIVRDPNDDFIIATAVKAEADYLVARDKDLLVLGAHRNTQIVSPEMFLRILNAAA